MLHGLTGSSELMRPLASRLCPEGWQLLLPEAKSSHPERGFAWWLRDATPAELLDVASLAQVAESTRGIVDEIIGLNPELVIVGGFSQGAAMALELLNSKLEPMIKGLILLSGKAASDSTLSGLAATSASQQIPVRPVLWMHGRRDRVVPFAQAEQTLTAFRDASWPVTALPHEKGHMVDLSQVAAIQSWIDDIVV
jgi:phospholipase/carboxylesterase